MLILLLYFAYLFKKKSFLNLLKINNKSFILSKSILELSNIYVLLLFVIFIAIMKYIFYIYFISKANNKCNKR